MQDRAKQEGIKWVFHTPYYPQSSGMVERANGLLKSNPKPHQFNNRYGPTGSHVNWAFFGKTELRAPLSGKRKYLTALQPGLPVMADLPSTGTVPVTLSQPCGPLAWEATDSSGAKHRVGARCIFFLLFNGVTCSDSL